MPASDQESEEEQHARAQGATLDTDGRLHRAPLPAEEPPPTVAALTEEPLELPEPRRRQHEPLAETYREEPRPARRPRRLAWGVFLGALLLGLGALAAALLVPRQRWPGPVRALAERVGRALGDVSSTRRPTVVVTSEPSGATVRIAGQVVGTTPWAGDHLWGDTTLTVERRGYRTHTARLEAGKDLTVNASLTPR